MGGDRGPRAANGDKADGGAGWAGIAGPNDLAVACWLGEGEKGKSLSVLATKAEGGHLLHQLKERAGRKRL